MSEERNSLVQKDDPYVVRVWHGDEGRLLQWVLYAVLAILLSITAIGISNSVPSFPHEVAEENKEQIVPDESRAGILRAVSDLTRGENKPQEEKLKVLEDLADTASASTLSDSEKLELLSKLKGI